MKIVFFTDFYYPDLNGVSSAVDLSAHGLRNLGHTVYIVAPSAAHPTPEDHPDVIRLPSTPGMWHKEMRDGYMTPKNARLIKSLKADIFHFHTNGVTGIGGMRIMFALNMPAVAHYHTDYEEYSKIYRGMWAGLLTGSLFGPLFVGQQKAWPESWQGIKPKKSFKEWNENMVRNVVRLSYIYFESVIVPSKKMKEKLRSYGVTSKITILPTGLDPSEFDLSIKPSSHSRYELLYVGRISREKNVDVLIDTMHELAKQKVNVHLTMVGPGPHYLARTRKRVRDLKLNKYITITGGLPRKKALSYYQQSDAFVFPSLTDTQALVLNEAAYASLPLIFSDAEISIIAEDKITGIQAQATGRSFAEAINKLIKHPRLAKQYGQAAHKRATTLTIDNQAKSLEKIYRHVIKNHTSYESVL